MKTLKKFESHQSSGPSVRIGIHQKKNWHRHFLTCITSIHQKNALDARELNTQQH